MSLNGTAEYRSWPVVVPELVGRAVRAAEELGFELCVHPATGQLLGVLAGGVAPGGLIGETGTGTGAGLAWMATNADPEVALVSVELDAERAEAAKRVFVHTPNVTVIHGDAVISSTGVHSICSFMTAGGEPARPEARRSGLVRS